MRVLLTGAGGQVGAAVVLAKPAHVELTALSHSALDIADENQVRAIVQQLRPQVVINAAAYTAVDRAESEPALARAVNESGPRNLASAVAQNDARLLHLSTDYVFDGGASRAWQPDSPPGPLNTYGWSKLAGEQAVLALAAERSVVLRTAWVYAATGNNFLRTMLRLMRERELVRVVADQVGAPTAAGSIASVLWRLVELPAVSGVHHWTDAGIASWYDFAVAIAEEGHALGLLPRQPQVVPIATEEYPTAARRPHFSVLDTRSTVAATGLSPVHWRTRLRRVLAEIARE